MKGRIEKISNVNIELNHLIIYFSFQNMVNTKQKFLQNNSREMWQVTKILKANKIIQENSTKNTQNLHLI